MISARTRTLFVAILSGFVGRAITALLPLVLFPLLGVASHAAAQTFPERPDGERRFYADEAGLIDPATGAEIDRIAAALLADEGFPIIVVTMSSLASHGAAFLTIEEYARRLFDEWGIGSEQRNYGMLLLVSQGDRQARIELGAEQTDQPVDPGNSLRVGELLEVLHRFLASLLAVGRDSQGPFPQPDGGQVDLGYLCPGERQPEAVGPERFTGSHRPRRQEHRGGQAQLAQHRRGVGREVAGPVVEGQHGRTTG